MSMIATRAWAPAAAAVVLLLSPIRAATADEFADLCVGGGVGLEAEDCACIDSRLTEPAERGEVIALLRTEVEAQRNGDHLDETSPDFERRMQILDKYINECVR
jgi:hypothetical protein